MKSKKAIYRAKSVLSADEATRYLAELTSNLVRANDLLELGQAYNLKAYLKPTDFDSEGIDHKTGETKILIGSLHECVTGLQFAKSHYTGAFRAGDITLMLGIDPDRIITGRGETFLDDEESAEIIDWRATPDVVEVYVGDFNRGAPLYFKPADIEALAAKINGKPPIQEELEQLRQRVAELEAAKGPTLKKGDVQRAVILTTIMALGYDPKALPTGSGSKQGAKGKVRKIVQGKDYPSLGGKLFYSQDAFNSVWKKMKVENVIKDG